MDSFVVAEPKMKKKEMLYVPRQPQLAKNVDAEHAFGDFLSSSARVPRGAPSVMASRLIEAIAPVARCTSFVSGEKRITF